MKNRLSLIVVFFFAGLSSSFPQEKKESIAIEKIMASNIYECVSALDTLIPKEEAKKYQALSEEEFTNGWNEGNIQHAPLQNSIVNSFEFHPDSSLYKYFVGYELYERLSMAEIILIAYHRTLNNKPLDLENAIKEHIKKYSQEGSKEWYEDYLKKKK